MLKAITILLAFQLAGEVLVKLFTLPIPGPVVGMLLLFFTLLIRGGVPATLRETSQSMLQHLSLLFVPAGVGIIVHFGLLQSEWSSILFTLVVSTIITLLLTAGTMLLLLYIPQKSRRYRRKIWNRM